MMFMQCILRLVQLLDALSSMLSESFNNSACIQFNSNEFTYSIHKKECILFFTMFLFSIENYQMIIMQLSMCASTTSKHKYLGL